MRALLPAAVVLVGACGGLDNRPLLTGAVSGRATSCDAAGVAGVVGDVERRAGFQADCTFRLEGLEPGTHELFVAPDHVKARLLTVEVRATELTELGEVMARPGAFVRVQVQAPALAELEGELTAPDLPLEASAVGRSGMARLGPFPPGCFRLRVTMKGLGARALMSCLGEGEERSVDVTY